MPPAFLEGGGWGRQDIVRGCHLTAEYDYGGGGGGGLSAFGRFNWGGGGEGAILFSAESAKSGQL